MKTIIKSIKSILIKVAVCIICAVAFWTFIWAMLPKVTYLDGYITPSSGSGYVYVNAEDGNTYRCYGDANGIVGEEVTITLEGDRFVDFELK